VREQKKVDLATFCIQKKKTTKLERGKYINGGEKKNTLGRPNGDLKTGG